MICHSFRGALSWKCKLCEFRFQTVWHNWVWFGLLGELNHSSYNFFSALGGRLGYPRYLKASNASVPQLAKNECPSLWMPTVRSDNNPSRWIDVATGAEIDPKLLIWDKGEPNGLLGKENCVEGGLNRYPQLHSRGHVQLWSKCFYFLV